VHGVTAVLGIIMFVIVGAMILTGAGIVISAWQFPAEKCSQQEEKRRKANAAGED